MDEKLRLRSISFLDSIEKQNVTKEELERFTDDVQTLIINELKEGKAININIRVEMENLSRMEDGFAGKFRKAPSPGAAKAANARNNVDGLIKRLIDEGMSTDEISIAFSVLGKSPLDKNVDSATLLIMASRMQIDLEAQKEAKEILRDMEKGAPDRALGPENSPGSSPKMAPRPSL